MSHYKLTYFNNRLRAEPIRWIFAAAKQPFEDNRISSDDWQQLRGTYLFGHLPVLEVDGKRLYQSHAIMNYLAREFGLAGNTPYEQAQVNMIALTVEDAFYKPSLLIFQAADDATERHLLDKYTMEQLPFFLSKFEYLLPEHHSGQGRYFVGNKMTYADIVIVCFLEELYNSLYIQPDLDKYPKLATLKSRVETTDGISEWLARRAPPGDKSLLHYSSEWRAARADDGSSDLDVDMENSSDGAAHYLASS